MLIPQLYRARWTNEYFTLLLKNIGLKTLPQNVIKTFMLLALILHFVSCFWMAVTEANLSDSVNWVNESGFADSGMLD